LIVASHRGPLTPVLIDGSLRLRPSTGGLVNVLGPALSTVGTVWLSATPAAGLSSMPSSETPLLKPDDKLAFISIDPEIYDLYYNVMSNEVLWALFHNCFDQSCPLPTGGRLRAAWRAYVAVNRQFASQIARRAHKGETVIVHDYHLMLVAGLLRKLRSDLKIAFFHHIPFAGPGAFQVLPPAMRRVIMSSLGSIPVGFQSAKWQLAFEQECSNMADRRISFSFVHPVSPDFEHVQTLAREPQVVARRRELRSLTSGQFLMARADRMDPMKNVVHGLHAIALLLERDPSLARTFVFVNHLVSTRTTVVGYEDYAKAIRATARQINSLWADGAWSPIVLEEGDDYLRAIALLAEYDALLVNSVREGMNLVAQEGPLINRRHGVLLLSTQTGAYDRLQGPAIGVRPLDIPQTASALRRAMLMRQEERQRRALSLRERVLAGAGSRWHDQLVEIVERNQVR
jgi:trehalose 6-phosphate synthase